MPDTISIKQPHSFEWVNNLRVIALFCVIILHVTSLLLMQYGKVPLNQWLIADFYNALVRFAVPVFVMITGALLLHREYELGDFLKKRFSRLLWPFLFWSLVYITYSWYNGDVEFGDDTLVNVKIVLLQLQKGSFYHLWYVYMLIGLYLFIPIISKFVRNATDKELIYFIAVWYVVMIFTKPYLSAYAPQVDVHYFTGYLGYLVLGHYLAFCRLPGKNFKGWMIVLFFFALGAITFETYLLTVRDDTLSTTMFEPLGPYVAVFASSVILWARSAKFTLPLSLIKLRGLIGSLSLGMYLCHALFLVLLDQYLGISHKLCNPVFSIPITAMVCFVLSFLLVYAISKIPYIGKYISG